MDGNTTELVATFGTIGIIIVLGIILMVVLQIIATVWLWNDSRQYGENQVVWALLSLCFNFALVVPVYYFCFRSNGKIPCKHCGIWFKPIGKNCPHCGRNI